MGKVMSVTRFVLATVAVVAFLYGCAGKPPLETSSSDPFESLVSSAGNQVPMKITLVVTRTDQVDAVDLSGAGWLSNVGRGAGIGAGEGAKVGIVCFSGGGVGVIIFGPACVAAGAIVGAIVGGTYGAVASESGSTWSEAETAFQTAVADLALDELLSSHVVAFAHEHGYKIQRPQDIPVSSTEGWSAPALAQQGMHTVLEIRDPTPRLVPTKFEVNPALRLVVAAQVRLIVTDDETVLVDRVISDDLSPHSPI